MTMDATGKTLHCDGEDCQARTPAPVALHSAAAEPGKTRSAHNWLFVVREQRSLHFCPNCTRSYLNRKPHRVHSPQEHLSQQTHEKGR